ncbi:MAG: PBP1A family penicillin-binding protein [Magnetococcales bacterium]|nr:PBP1A family penicillin-binding protein [Magnetococcales bacterium]
MVSKTNRYKTPPRQGTRKAANPVPGQPPVRKGKFFGCLFNIIALLLLLGMAGGVLTLLVYRHQVRELPSLDDLTNYQPSLVTRIFARDYQLLGEFYIQRRQFVPMKDVPPMLVKAFLAVEDSRFYEHIGIDPVGIARAMYANLAAGRVTQGASTITQQVARTFLLSSVRTVDRKIKEMILSLSIEKKFTKDEILELYVNQIYLGAGAYGVASASRIYFDKDVSELNIGQMALLAGLPKAPSRYSPWRYPDRARARQKLVLGRMVEVGLITTEQADLWAERDFGLARPERPLEQVAPHYLEHVRRNIQSEWGNGQLYRGGLDVYTALDPGLQRAAYKAILDGLAAYDRRHGYRGPIQRLDNVRREALLAWVAQHRDENRSVNGYIKGVVTAVAKKNGGASVSLVEEGREILLTLEGVQWARKQVGDKKTLGPAITKVEEVLSVGDIIWVERGEKENTWKLAQEPLAEAAMVVMDPHTGQLLAMVGGRDFGRSEFNRATQSRRQPGSAFKPFLYSAAFDRGYSPTMRIDDSPLSIAFTDPSTGEVREWRPENYEHKFYGPTTLRSALVHSRNLVTIRLVKRIGLSKIIPLLRRFGLDIPPERRNLSVSLGTYEFTPLQMVTGYCAFANGGKLVEPVYIARIQDRYGRTVYRHRGGDCLLCHQEPKAIVLKSNDTQDETQKPMTLFGKRVLDPPTAYQMTNLLKGVVTHGTARKAVSLGRPLAGKTGTTNDMRDAWFIGFSPALVAGVWVGYDDYGILGGTETGAMAALPIWMDFMREALKEQPATDFSVPAGIQLEPINAETGEFAQPDNKGMVMEAFKPGQSPLSPEFRGAPFGDGGTGDSEVPGGGMGNFGSSPESFGGIPGSFPGTPDSFGGVPGNFGGTSTPPGRPLGIPGGSPGSSPGRPPGGSGGGSAPGIGDGLY